MDARPTPEQRELDDAAIRLAEKLGPTAVGDLDDVDRRERLDAALVQAGWRELRTGTASEPLASGVEAALVARSLARGACDVAFVGPVLAHDLLRRPASVAADDGRPRTIAVTTDLSGLARGSGLAVDAAGSSAALALDADRHHTRASSRSSSTDDWPTGSTSPVARVRSRPIPARTGASLGPLSADDLLAWEALAVTLTAADLVGVMEGALELATAYAKDRRQYGVPIGSFQAVQHLLAEAKTLTEGALSAMLLRGLGGRRARAGRGPRAPPRWPRRTPPAAPARCARPRSRCTAASATRGSAWPTCSCAGRCCRPSSSVATARSSPCSRNNDGEPAMDFRDSPDEAEFRAADPRLARRTGRRRSTARTATTATGRRSATGTSSCTTPASSR